MNVVRNRLLISGVLLSILGAVVLSVLSFISVNPSDSQVTIDTNEASGFIEATQSWLVDADDCAILRWNLQNIAAVYLNEAGDVGENQREICADDYGTYSFRVVYTDLSEQSFRFTIEPFWQIELVRVGVAASTLAFCMGILFIIYVLWMNAPIRPRILKALQANATLVNSLIVIGILIFPFLYFPMIALGFNGEYLAISNDFVILYAEYKYYLLDNLSSGHFPLWSAAEGAGFAFYANPFTQSMYPLNLPLLLLYELNDGYSLFHHQRFTIFGLSIFGLGLFTWLRTFRLSTKAILFGTVAMMVGTKMAEILRFPNAVHTIAWIPWILFAITAIFFAKSFKHRCAYAVLLFVVGFMFLTGGYPYYVIYAIFLVGPYTLLLIVPPLKRIIWDDKPVAIIRGLGACVGVGLLLLVAVTPYYLNMSDLLSQTTDRGGDSFEYSSNFPFELEDTFGSFVYPRASQAEGIYYFSSLGFLMVLLYLMYGIPGKQPDEPWYHSSILKLILVGWFLTITYITWTRDSLLFRFLWDTVPGFSSLRMWGRMNIILVPFLALVLSIAYTSLEDQLKSPQGRRYLLIAGLCLGSIIVSVQIYFRIVGAVHIYFIGNVLIPPGLQYVFFGILATLIVVGLSRWQFKQRTLLFLFLLTVVLFDVKGGLINYWIWNNGVRPIPPVERLYIQESVNPNAFSTPRNTAPGYRTLTLTSEFNTNIVPNWYFESYVEFLGTSEDEPELQNFVLGGSNGQRLFFTSQVNHQNLADFVADASTVADTFSYSVERYTGDRLVVDVTTESAGWLTFVDNMYEGWTVSVNGEEQPIVIALGTFKAVALPVGEHRVIFSYDTNLWWFD